MSYPITITSSTYTIDTGYNIFFCDCTSNSITLEMPELLYDCIRFLIKRIDTSSNTLTLNINTFDYIDIENSSSPITFAPYDYIEIISYNSQWWIIDR